MIQTTHINLLPCTGFLFCFHNLLTHFRSENSPGYFQGPLKAAVINPSRKSTLFATVLKNYQPISTLFLVKPFKKLFTNCSLTCIIWTLLQMFSVMFYHHSIKTASIEVMICLKTVAGKTNFLTLKKPVHQRIGIKFNFIKKKINILFLLDIQ